MKIYVGVDLGGTNTKIGILNGNFEILAESSIKTLSQQGPEDTFTRIWEKIKEMFKELNLNEDNIEGIGLGIPGPVVNNSIVKIAANFSWGNNFNAKEVFERISKKQVIVENDVRLITIGEHQFGAAKNYSNAIVIPIGTGISAGIIVNNMILTGRDGAAGEFGHVSLLNKGIKCGCGLSDCLELNCSARGILRIADEVLDNTKDIEFSSIDNLEAYHIFNLYNQGNETAKKIVDIFCDNLSKGIGMLINIINPEVIVLAGGVSKSADIIIEGIKKHLHKYALGISLDNLNILKCKLGDKAGILGSSSLIINKKKGN